MLTAQDVRATVAARLGLIVVSLLYAAGIHFAFVNYLGTVHEYWGFVYSEPDTAEVLFMAALVMIAASALPSMLTRPSTIILLLLFVTVFIPTTVISLCLATDNIPKYGTGLAMLCAAFVIASAFSRLSERTGTTSGGLPGELFCRVMLLAWLGAFAILVYSYRSTMAFVSLGDVYEQRAIGASTSLAMGYLQTYFINVVSSSLLAIGLIQRRATLVAVGVAGCVLLYMINAQRTVFLLPVAVFALYVLLKFPPPILRTTAFPILGLTIAVVLSVVFHEDSSVASVLSTFLVNRMLAIPGLTFSHYYDVFGTEGFTWWSHVKGIDLLVAAPRSFASDPLWPGLGYIVGDRIYGDPLHNFNANLFSGDGVAAAGAFGVLVIGWVLGIWLLLLDSAAVRWNRNFAMLVTLPVALALTNGHLFTTMLSFGGLFWLLFFTFFRPTGEGPAPGSRAVSYPKPLPPQR
ncbi:MAG: hypothetical protein AB1761_00755 [Pseudomonadota bacterium]